jgi:type IV secretion system protein VirD4
VKRRSLISAIQNGLTIHQALSALRNEDTRAAAEEEARRKREGFVPGVGTELLENAQLATLADLRRSGLGENGALYVGHKDGQFLFYTDAAPLLTYAPTGAGKFFTMLAANLAHATGHTLIVNDPKGEASQRSYHHRAKRQEGRVYCLDPFGETGLPAARYNPCSILNATAARGEDVGDEALTIASMILPPLANEGSNAWIRETAFILTFVAASALAIASPRSEGCTLGKLFDISTGDLGEFVGFLERIATEERFPHWLRQEAAGFLSGYATLLPDGSRQIDAQRIGWFRDKMKQALFVFRPGGKARVATDGNDFDPAALKRHPSTVYVVLPGKRVESHGLWASLTLYSLIEETAAAPGPVRCTFMLDELGNLQRIPNLLKALRQYRGPPHNVQLWAITQGRESFEGTPEAPLYGEHGWREFESQAAVFQVWDMGRSRRLCEDLSALSGQYNVFVPSANVSGSGAGDGYGEGGGYQLRPRLSVHDVSRIGSGRQLLMVRGASMAVAERVPYTKIPGWRDAILPPVSKD